MNLVTAICHSLGGREVIVVWNNVLRVTVDCDENATSIITFINGGYICVKETPKELKGIIDQEIQNLELRRK
jgi:glutamate formiminotransferase